MEHIVDNSATNADSQPINIGQNIVNQNKKLNSSSGSNLILTREEKENLMINKFKKAFALTLENLNTQRNIDSSNRDSGANDNMTVVDDDNISIASSKILSIGNKNYKNTKLPAIFGSRDYSNLKYLGLIDEQTSNAIVSENNNININNLNASNNVNNANPLGNNSNNNISSSNIVNPNSTSNNIIINSGISNPSIPLNSNNFINNNKLSYNAPLQADPGFNSATRYNYNSNNIHYNNDNNNNNYNNNNFSRNNNYNSNDNYQPRPSNVSEFVRPNFQQLLEAEVSNGLNKKTSMEFNLMNNNDMVNFVSNQVVKPPTNIPKIPVPPLPPRVEASNQGAKVSNIKPINNNKNVKIPQAPPLAVAIGNKAIKPPAVLPPPVNSLAKTNSMSDLIAMRNIMLNGNKKYENGNNDNNAISKPFSSSNNNLDENKNNYIPSENIENLNNNNQIKEVKPISFKDNLNALLSGRGGMNLMSRAKAQTTEESIPNNTAQQIDNNFINDHHNNNSDKVNSFSNKINYAPQDYLQNGNNSVEKNYRSLTIAKGVEKSKTITLNNFVRSSSLFDVQDDDEDDNTGLFKKSSQNLSFMVMKKNQTQSNLFDSNIDQEEYENLNHDDNFNNNNINNNITLNKNISGNNTNNKAQMNPDNKTSNSGEKSKNLFTAEDNNDQDIRFTGRNISQTIKNQSLESRKSNFKSTGLQSKILFISLLLIHYSFISF